MSIEKSIHKMGNNSSVVHKDTPCQQDLLPSSSENAARIDDSSLALPSSRRSSRKRKTLSSCLSTLSPKKDEATKKKRKRQKDAETEFDMLWICSECKEAECMMKADAEQLLICEGTCRRLFHYPCAGLSQLPDQEEEYICKDCIEQRHPCCICNEYGVDNETVFCCSKDSCGLFFHESCLSMQNVEVHIVSENGGTANSRESCSASEASNNEEPNLDDHKQSQTREKRVFVCPAHACWTCTQLDLQKQEADASSKQTNRKNGHHNKKRKKKKKKGGSTAFAAKSESKICVSNALLTVRRSD